MAQCVLELKSFKKVNLKNNETYGRYLSEEATKN